MEFLLKGILLLLILQNYVKSILFNYGLHLECNIIINLITNYNK